MRIGLAIWSWILPIIGAILYVIALTISSGMRVEADLGSPITTQERLFGLVFAITFLLIIITGFIFSIISLRRVNKNLKISGKWHAIVGIILNAILFFYGLLILGSVLVGG